VAVCQTCHGPRGEGGQLGKPLESGLTIDDIMTTARSGAPARRCRRSATRTRSSSCTTWPVISWAACCSSLDTARGIARLREASFRTDVARRRCLRGRDQRVDPSSDDPVELATLRYQAAYAM